MSRGRIILLPIARREILDAVAWHDRVSPSLGDRILQEANRGLEQILANPAAFSFTFLGTRAFRLSSFPYLLYYQESGAGIVVFAFRHEKQDTVPLQRRLP